MLDRKVFVGTELAYLLQNYERFLKEPCPKGVYAGCTNKNQVSKWKGEKNV